VLAQAVAEVLRHPGTDRERLRKGGDGRTFLRLPLVPSKVIRTRLISVLVGGVLALAVAGAVGELRDAGSSRTSETGAAQRRSVDTFSVPAENTTAPLPRCSAEQIATSIDVLGGRATIAVRHARGRACHLARLPVQLKMRDRVGNPVRLPTTEGAHIPFQVGGDFSSGFERLLWIHRVFPDCNQRGPFLVVAKVGAYVARRTLSRSEVACFRGG
jgi:hypothetical protein